MPIPLLYFLMFSYVHDAIVDVTATALVTVSHAQSLQSLIIHNQVKRAMVWGPMTSVQTAIEPHTSSVTHLTRSASGASMTRVTTPIHVTEVKRTVYEPPPSSYLHLHTQ